VAPYTPGGAIDTTARLLAAPMSVLLGQPVVVENRAGSSGMIGAAEVARAAPDGHTLLVDASPHLANPLVMSGLPFDYATAFAPVMLAAIIPQILIVPNSSSARTLPEFVALAKARPGQLAYATPGGLTAGHFASVLLANRAGIEMVHVPYRGGTAALPDLISGTTAMMMATVSSGFALVREGRVRAIGVTTAQRLPNLPEVPTIAEQGFPGYELNEWNALFVTAGTPPAVVTRLNQAAQQALKDETLLSRFATLGATPVGGTAEEFASFLSTQREVLGKLIRDNGLTAG
jgi:tripartite-type tricarboxylate transporter receptor subunit TctC